jgi:hypothetical protein
VKRQEKLSGKSGEWEELIRDSVERVLTSRRMAIAFFTVRQA